jgi:hypothetical protein
MNLVQLSEQLKDVPDSFLQNEVTNPTGAYPAYLVVSELRCNGFKRYSTGYAKSCRTRCGNGWPPSTNA